jgi:large subunit ribosomal protein L23
MKLIKPILSEKTLKDAAGKKYTFRVDPRATKLEIKQEVEKTFGVKVLKVATVTLTGKTYRSGRRWIMRTRPDGKKAMVSIQPDKKIELFEVSESKK